MIRVNSNTLINTGIAGALLGGAFSIAKNMKDCKEKSISNEEAVGNVIKDMAGAGLATTSGIIVAGAVGLTGLGAIIIATGATAGAKYLFDNMAQNSPLNQPRIQEK